MEGKNFNKNAIIQAIKQMEEKFENAEEDDKITVNSIGELILGSSAISSKKSFSKEELKQFIEKAKKTLSSCPTADQAMIYFELSLFQQK